MRRKVLPAIATTVLLSWAAAPFEAAASEFWYGCRSRPACGKVCRLVCETKEIKSICYACECDEICIPGKSKRGCKHCDVACCPTGCDAGADGCEPCDECRHTPRCEFCWRDWVPCGCAKPRKIKVLTKYEAVKEICWYHWEVVDACSCGCAEGCDGTCEACCGACDCAGVNGKPARSRCIYKVAPEDAELGAVLAVSEEERVQLVAFLTGAPPADAAASEVLVADITPTAPETETVEAAEPTFVERMAAAVGLGRR